jgi:predicted site-specific integrase-resolvase
MYPAPHEFAGQTFGIYPRVSSAAQATEDKVSLDVQIDDCREYGERLGMVLDRECVRKEAHTATTTERPALKELLRDMIARKMGNLVIDRADRLTREGILAAAYLLTQFTDAGILLHVASVGMVVRDEMGVNMFMQMASAGQQANTSRTRAIVQTKKGYARGGRYLSGNRPPYGFVKVVDKRNAKGQVTEFHFDADLRDLDGYRPWEVRRDILRGYQEGRSPYQIAEWLTVHRVPTSRTLAGQPHASPHWSDTTIRDFLRDPINEGIVTSFRRTWEWAPPDARHPKRWKRHVWIAPDDRIDIPNAVAPEAVLLTPAEAARIRLRLPQGVQSSPRRATPETLERVLLLGGLARCGQPRLDDPNQPCGGALRLKHNGRKTWSGYVCATHEKYRLRCPGMPAVATWLLDALVWFQVQHDLLHTDRLERLAEEQARLDAAGDDPASKLRTLRTTRDGFARRVKNLRDSIADTDNPDSRASLVHDLDEYQTSLRQADEDLAAYARVAQNEEHRRAVLSSLRYQVGRHVWRLLLLDTRRPGDVPSIRTILRSLGVQATVRRREDGTPDLTIEYNLGIATGAPWFTDEDAYTPTDEEASLPAELHADAQLYGTAARWLDWHRERKAQDARQDEREQSSSPQGGGASPNGSY